MSAQSWSVKGIDPKVREAAREAAARKGLSLAEYLNQALGAHLPPNGHDGEPPHAPPTLRQRSTRYLGAQDFDGEDEEWRVGGARGNDPARLVQRIESIERRTQLAVTGLDRAVSTIDRSVLGLAARIEDAEAMSGEAAERITHALEQFRIAGETLGGRLERAEYEAGESRRALDNATSELGGAKERLEQQVAVAGDVARRAEAAVSYLSEELKNKDSAHAQTLALARTVAEDAARQAAEASADAVKELRLLQEELHAKVGEAETATRRAIADAVADVRSEASSETRSTREALLEEVVRLEGEIAKRVGNVDQIRTDQSALIARIERAEAGAREATAGLRQAAGAAIADLRNAQLTLTARVKQVEDNSGVGPELDLTGLRHAQQDIAERLKSLEAKTETSPVTDALNAFEARLAGLESTGANSGKLIEVDGAVKTLDAALQRLAARIAETESTANTAIRTLEETVSSLGARAEKSTAAEETEAVRAMLEQRLDAMAQSVTKMMVEARSELAGQLQSALEGVAAGGLDEALADVNRRLASAERRQAQTIEAISLEIKRMSETVDKRLRAVEVRNDDAAASAVREELARMSAQLEQRFDEIEHREAAAFDRMGLEIGRLSERLDERVGAVEARSAQAIEHVGEQVARMAERYNQRHEALSRELGERMLDSEERSSARVAEAIGSIMQRLAEVEEHSAEAIAPVQKAVSNVASKLEQIETAHNATPSEPPEPLLTIPTPTRRTGDFDTFGSDLSDPEPQPYEQKLYAPEPYEPTPYVSPLDAAQPVRAAPLPPASPPQDEIYFAEDIDDLLVEDAEEEVDPFKLPDFDSAPEVALDAATPLDSPPTEETFWTPEGAGAGVDVPFDESVFGAADGGEEHNFTPDIEALDNPPAIVEPAPPPGKNDYLSSARKAAQAQALPKTRAEPGPTPRLSLRGSSRVIMWGAASAVALLLVGGAWYLNGREDAANTAPEPRLDAGGAASVAPAQDVLEAPVDPFVQGPADPAASQTPPIAEAPSGAQPTAAVVAGPLAPRAANLQDAARAGDLTAQYELALQQIAAGRTQDGVVMLRRAADRGFAMAQYRMAKLYERGEGVPTDLSIARQWTERAAAAGNRRAMHDLGVYFARGEGAPLDEAAAFRWFRQAAELGVADSQYNLGILYQQGRGVNASATEALFWFLVAARQGDQDAAARATALEAQLAPMQIQQARARAEAFRPRASNAAANGEFGPRPWTRGT